MPSRDDIREAAELIGRHFGVDDPLDPREPLGGLPSMLARKILALLRDDLGKLTHLLYRIDVSETQVEAAFEADSLEEVAAALAELVVARELRTVAMRRSLDDGHDP